MKQFLFLLVIIIVGYYIFRGGISSALSKANINTKGIVSDIAESVVPSKLPDIAPERTGLKSTEPDSIEKIKQNTFITYDPEICFALVDTYYTSGYRNSPALVDEYLKMFDLPEDKIKILNMLSRYQDQQTYDMMKNFYTSNTFAKRLMLKKLAEFHNLDAAVLIMEATRSTDQDLAEAAQDLARSYRGESWFDNAEQRKARGY